MEQDKIKQKVLNYIKKREGATTYQIAKGCVISWSTANIKCFQLKSEGQITSEELFEGMNKAVHWKVNG